MRACVVEQFPFQLLVASSAMCVRRHLGFSGVLSPVAHTFVMGWPSSSTRGEAEWGKRGEGGGDMVG